MTPEQKAAYVMASAARVFAQTAGMQAENQQRIASGMSIAYGESSFDQLIEAEGCHVNAILGLFQDR